MIEHETWAVEGHALGGLRVRPLKEVCVSNERRFLEERTGEWAVVAVRDSMLAATEKMRDLKRLRGGVIKSEGNNDG